MYILILSSPPQPGTHLVVAVTHAGGWNISLARGWRVAHPNASHAVRIPHEAQGGEYRDEVNAFEAMRREGVFDG